MFDERLLRLDLPVEGVAVLGALTGLWLPVLGVKLRGLLTFVARPMFPLVEDVGGRVLGPLGAVVGGSAFTVPCAVRATA